jgi:hypothetical protein
MPSASNQVRRLELRARSVPAALLAVLGAALALRCVSVARDFRGPVPGLFIAKPFPRQSPPLLSALPRPQALPMPAAALILYILD